MDVQGEDPAEDGSVSQATTPPSGPEVGKKTNSRSLVWILAGVVAVLLIVVATGLFLWRPWVTPTVSASPTPSVSSPTLTPTPTSTPVASVLTISIAGLELTDSAGNVIWTHALTDDGNAVAADLQTAFGLAPTVTDRSSDAFSIFETEYRWDGFLLITNRATWDDSPDSLLRAYQVWGKAPAVGPISLETPEGIQVGQSASVLAPFADASTFDSGSVTCYVVERDPVQGTDDPAQGGMFTGPFLGVCSDNATALVATILSPDYLFLDT